MVGPTRPSNNDYNVQGRGRGRGGHSSPGRGGHSGRSHGGQSGRGRGRAGVGGSYIGSPTVGGAWDGSQMAGVGSATVGDGFADLCGTCCGAVGDDAVGCPGCDR